MLRKLRNKRGHFCVRFYDEKREEAVPVERFIPFEKLSKKEQRKRNRDRRGTWGPLRPVTRRSENPKAYNRRKEQSRRRDADSEYS